MNRSGEECACDQLCLNSTKTGPVMLFGERLDLGARASVVFLAGGPARAGIGRKRRAVDELRWPLGPGDAREERLVQPVAPLVRRHAAHALAQGDAQPRQVGVLIQDLRHRFPGVPHHQLACCIRLLPDVTQAHAPGSDRVRTGELRRHEDVPVEQIRFNAAFPGHRKDASPELLPFCQLGIAEPAGLREIPRPDHVGVRMQAPKREDIEPVLGHHVQEGLPVPDVLAGFLVLLEGRTRSIGRPRQVELDRAKLELRPRRAVGNPVERNTGADLLRHVQHAVHRTTFVGPGDPQALARPDPSEPVRTDGGRRRGIHGNGNHGGCSRPWMRRLLQDIASGCERFLQFAQREAAHRGIGRTDADVRSFKRSGTSQERGWE